MKLLFKFQDQSVKVWSNKSRSPNAVLCGNMWNFVDMAYINSTYRRTYSNSSILKLSCENLRN